MTTKNFVPRINGEGQVGTETKKWSKIYSDSVYVNNIIGNLTGTADKAIKDNKNQQIDSTYIKNISISNDTLTITKGNDDSQDITINNISHAISSDNATNANKLQELTAGNSNGQIPISNGIENVNLNAALLNGKSSNDFATSSHIHNTATQSSNGYMSNTDKKKLDGIASGAEVNQNAFANLLVGSTTIQADSKQDTLTLAAGTNIALTPDGNNDKVTIGVTGKVASASTADKVNGTASDGGVADLVYGTMANNDFFRIRVGGSNDSGYAEIATADGGNEPIYVRQYAGTSFTAVTRTATLLDSSGNTLFPGKVTASGGFSGNLSGTATNATSATKATQDKNGLQIDTNYLKLSGGTMNGTLNTSKTTNTYLAGNQGQAIINSTATNGGYTMLAKMNSTNGKFTHGVYQGGYLLQYTNNTTISAGTNAVTKSVTLLDESGNTNFPGTVTASSFNGTSTKATQDSAGQTINTTYVKAVTASNATITVTKGNGSTSTATINNVAHATNADNATKATNDSSNRNIVNTYATKASPAFTGTPTAPTAAVSTNNTQIATTAFTQSLLKNKFTANTDYNGWSKNSVTGIVKQWGVVTYNSSPNPQVITPPISFSKLLTCGATDVGWKIGTGNTFANMEFTYGKLYIRPVYGNGQPGDNGVVLHWWVDCLL